MSLKHVWLILLCVWAFCCCKSTFAEDKKPEPRGVVVAPGSLYRLSDTDKAFLATVKKALLKQESEKVLRVDIDKAARLSSIPKNIDGVAIVLYQPKVARLVVLRRGTDFVETVVKTVLGAHKHKRFKNFSIDTKARVQIDFMSSKPTPFDISKAEIDGIGPQRFEFGVDGLVVNMKAEKRTSYLLPGDAFVRSRLGFRQLGDQIKKDLKLKQSVELTYKKFNSYSFISYKDDWLELYRGMPFPWSIVKKDIEDAALEGAKHLIRYQGKDGKFLYYYNPTTDSLVDHEHPRKDPIKDGYYNIIRHIAAIPLLLRYYDHTKDTTVLTRVEKALWFASAFTKKYPLSDGTTAAYIYQYKKAKLGATGVFLHAMVEYQKVAKVKKFDELIEQVTRHLLHEVYPSGEFRYYSIFDDKEITPETNAELFDFYYPGEALLGLASFIKSRDAKDPLALQATAKVHAALYFLIHERPKKYQGMFPSLPMDAWVAMALAELWGDKEFQKQEYLQFAFENADTVMKQQYGIENGLYPDYPGAYFYSYGDNSYPDGSRAEGVMAALKLAEKVGDSARVAKYVEALQITARALYILVNTPQSTYSVPNPAKTIGGIRFKQTRQWFRIDTIAHVANVYFDLLPYWSDEKDRLNMRKIIAVMSNTSPLMMTPVKK